MDNFRRDEKRRGFDDKVGDGGREEEKTGENVEKRGKKRRDEK